MKQSKLKIEIGKIFTIILNEKNLTQEKLGEILGINRRYVSRILSKDFRQYSIERILNFINKLGYEIEIKISKSLDDICQTHVVKIGE